MLKNRIIRRLSRLASPPLRRSQIITSRDEAISEIPTSFTFRANLGDPQDITGKAVEFMDPPSPAASPRSVLSMKDVVVTGPHGWIFKDKRLLVRATWHSGHDDRLFQHWSTRFPPRHLPGLTLSLATDYASPNYGHFLLDLLPRLMLLDDSDAYSPNDFDHIIVNGPKTGWKLRLLKQFDVPEDRTIWLTLRPFYCDHLVATDFPGVRRVYAPETVNYLRTRLLVDTHLHTATNRLFIVRRGKERQLTNQLRLMEIAAKFGFVPYLPEYSASSIVDFQNAEAVIGVHGAGLSDVGFMSPGSKVLELMPSDHRFPYFYSLGSAVGIDYRILIGEAVPSWNGTEPIWPSNRAFHVDDRAFRKYLKDNFS